MNLSDLLPRHAIVPELASSDLPGVFTELATPIAAHHGLRLSEVTLAASQREALGSTAIGGGVAIPHGVHAGLAGIAASLGRSRAGISMPSPDGERVHIFVMLMRPPHATSAHLKTLARVSHVLGSSAQRTALLEAEDLAAIERWIAQTGR